MIEAQNRNFLTYILLVLLARFQLGNQSAQLGSARLGNFTARACSSWKIPAQTHPLHRYKKLAYWVAMIFNES